MIEKLHLKGLYFDFIRKTDNKKWSGIFCCFDPIKREFHSEVNELVLGHFFCVGLYGYTTDEIVEISIKNSEVELVEFKTKSGEIFEVLSLVSRA